MSFDSTQFMAQMAELRNNRDGADVTLNCQGELIKAHSFILGTRYDFKQDKLSLLFMRNPHNLSILFLRFSSQV